MAKARLTVQLLVRDMPRARLLMWELNELAGEMRVSANPYAERLTHIIDRFAVDLASDEPEPPKELDK